MFDIGILLGVGVEAFSVFSLFRHYENHKLISNAILQFPHNTGLYVKKSNSTSDLGRAVIRQKASKLPETYNKKKKKKKKKKKNNPSRVNKDVK